MEFARVGAALALVGDPVALVSEAIAPFRGRLASREFSHALLQRGHLSGLVSRVAAAPFERARRVREALRAVAAVQELLVQVVFSVHAGMIPVSCSSIPLLDSYNQRALLR